MGCLWSLRKEKESRKKEIYIIGVFVCSCSVSQKYSKHTLASRNGRSMLVAIPARLENKCQIICELFQHNDQPVNDGTRSFIYADDLCITAQFPTFSQVESTIEEALGELTQYYRNNNLRTHPDKTQVTAFIYGTERQKDH